MVTSFDKHINESKKLYPYNCIVIVFDNIDDVKEFKKLKPETPNGEMNNLFIENAEKEIRRKGKIYILYDIYMNTVEWQGWSGIDYLPNHLINHKYRMEKTFTLNDVKNGLFRQILQNGEYVYSPTYYPRKKIHRLIEKRNSIEEAEEIYVIIYNKEENDILVKLLDDNDFQYIDGFIRTREIFPYIVFIRFKPDKRAEYTSGHRISQTSNINIHPIFDGVYDKIYTMKDIKTIEWIIRNGKIGEPSPTYEPKGKIKRILESTENKHYTSVVFEIEDEKENEIAQRNLFQFGFEWDHTDEIMTYDEYPVYLFAEISPRKRLSFMDVDSLDSYSYDYYEGIYGYIYYCNNENENVCDQVFDYDKTKYVETILMYGDYKPRYNPKKPIIRTLESIKQEDSKYRYKNIVVIVNSESEVIKLEKYLKSKYDCGIILHEQMYRFPNYIFIENINGIRSGEKCDICYLSDNPSRETLLDYIWSEQPIYNINQLNLIGSIIDTGKTIIKPNYDPKDKIKRTIESVGSNLDIQYVKKRFDQNPIDVIYYRHHNNQEYFNKVMEIKKKYPFFDFGYTSEISYDDLFGLNLFFTLKTVENWEQFKVYQNQQSDSDISLDYPDIKFSEMIANPNDLDRLLYEIIGKTPNYIPKQKTERIIESEKKIYKYDSISINTENPEQNIDLQRKLFDFGYKWQSQIEYNEPPRVILLGSRIILVNLINKSIQHISNEREFEVFKNTSASKIIKMDPNLYQYREIDHILNIIKYGYIPNYAPKKKIERTLSENIKILNYNIPYESIVLPPNKQKEIFKVGDIVLVRPDAYNYFRNVTDEMKHIRGKEIIIRAVHTMTEIYGSRAIEEIRNRYSDDFNPNDIIVYGKMFGYSEEEDWYWYYRCLHSKKLDTPDYTPRKKTDRKI